MSWGVVGWCRGGSWGSQGGPAGVAVCVLNAVFNAVSNAVDLDPFIIRDTSYNSFIFMILNNSL